MSLLFILLTVLIHFSHSAHLLVGSHSTSVSHLKFAFDVAEDMLKTGRHTVTEVRWPMMKAIADYPARQGFHSLLLNKSYEHASKLHFLSAMIDDSGWKKDDVIVDMFSLIKGIWPLFSLLCEEALEDENVARNLTSEGYTLGVLDTFSGVCATVVMRSAKIPFVFLSPLVEPFTFGHVTGVPVPYSYVMSVTVAKADHEMKLIDRAANVLGHSIFRLFFWLQTFFLSSQFNNTLGIVDLFKGLDNTMIFVNSHRFFEWPSPISFARVDIGHIKLPEAVKIPQEILDFIEEEQSLGTVIFSMSTFTSSGKMPENVMEMFAKAFAKFPNHRFVWRINNVPARLKAKNILTLEWIPQTELLNHDKTALLITHGGQNSVMEAISAGVPMIGIPMMGDQHPNIERVRTRNLGLLLAKGDLTEDNIVQRISQLLHNKEFVYGVKLFTKMFQRKCS